MCAASWMRQDALRFLTHNLLASASLSRKEWVRYNFSTIISVCTTWVLVFTEMPSKSQNMFISCSWHRSVQWNSLEGPDYIPTWAKSMRAWAKNKRFTVENPVSLAIDMWFVARICRYSAAGSAQRPNWLLDILLQWRLRWCKWLCLVGQPEGEGAVDIYCSPWTATVCVYHLQPGLKSASRLSVGLRLHLNLELRCGKVCGG